jgi:hypothetical protein
MSVTREECPGIFQELDWLEDQLKEECNGQRKAQIEWLIDSITLSLRVLSSLMALANKIKGGD